HLPRAGRHPPAPGGRRGAGADAGHGAGVRRVLRRPAVRAGRRGGRQAVVLTAATGSLASRWAKRSTISPRAVWPCTTAVGASAWEKYTPRKARPRRR